MTNTREAARTAVGCRSEAASAAIRQLKTDPTPPWRTMRRGLWRLSLAAMILLGSTTARAVDVEDVIWGFDGQVVHHRFNPVSVLFNNPKPEPFEGVVRVRSSSRAGTFTGAPIEEQLYVSPFQKRWVQFYVYNMEQTEQWTVSWGRRPNERYDLPQPNFGQPARVLLHDPQAIVEPGGALKRWEESRRQAFLDWIKRGGTVHLLHTSADKYPEFPADLAAALNAPVDTNHVGAGTVLRHPRTRSGLDREFVRTTILGEKPMSTETGSEGKSAEEIAIAEQQKKAQQLLASGQQDEDYSLFDYRGDGIFFEDLKTMTRPKHNWVVIHLMSFVYILVIFPGCFLIGRQRGDYRKTYAVLLVTVAMFSVGFSVVGARGYGESTTINAVAIARDLGDESWDVTEWSNAFVTRGDYYALSHQGTGLLYAANQDQEAVNGIIRNGSTGTFLVDIPPYSSRDYAHRMRLKDAGWRVRVVEWDRDQDGQLTKLVLGPPGRIPDDMIQTFVLHRRSIRSLTPQAGRLELAGHLGDITGFLRVNPEQRYRQPVFMFQNDDRTPEQRYREMANPLIARSLGLGRMKELTSFTLPDDRVRVFSYLPMDAAFGIKGEWFGKQQGYVMYVQDLRLEDESRSEKTEKSEPKSNEKKPQPADGGQNPAVEDSKSTPGA
jgi:hypothetical protein